MQYQPQQAISQAANTAVGSGMSAGAQVKTTAMNNATQMAIADANRFENQRQFNLTNKLYNRNASENERHNLSTEANADKITAWNTGGQQAAGDEEAKGIISAQINDLTTTLNSLDKNDPSYQKKAQYLRDRIKSIQDGGNKAAQTRGGLSGFAKGLANTYAKNGLFEGLGKELTRVGAQGPTPSAKPVAKTPSEISPVAVTSWPSSNGTVISLPSGSNINSFNLTGGSAPATLSGSVFNMTGTGQTNLTGVTTLGGQPVSGPLTIGPSSPATTPPATTPPATTPPAGTPPAATSGRTFFPLTPSAPTPLAPPAAASGTTFSFFPRPAEFRPTPSGL